MARQVPERSNRRAKKKAPFIIKFLSVILAALFLCACGLGAYAWNIWEKITNKPNTFWPPQIFVTPNSDDLTHDDDPFNDSPVDEEGNTEPVEAADPNGNSFVTQLLSEGYKYNQDLITIGFYGVDVLKERGNMGTRTDANLFLVVNTRTNELSMISVPRDTWTTVPKMNKDGKITSYVKARFNTAMVYGHGPSNYGYQNANKAYSMLTGGINVSSYIGFDMDGMMAIVDTLGGIPITMDVDFSSVGLKIKKGETATMNGSQTLVYVRARHGVNGGGDYGRMARQQKVAKIILESIKTRLKKNPLFVTDLYGSVKPYMDTNLTLEQMGVLAVQLKDADLSTIKNYTVKTKGANKNGASVEVYDEAALKELIRDVYFIK